MRLVVPAVTIPCMRSSMWWVGLIISCGSGWFSHTVAFTRAKTHDGGLSSSLVVDIMKWKYSNETSLYTEEMAYLY
ncbi:hypothetical protein F5Y11DRAFT_341398 [Daldinia sp. FL1419]|nr:hypothetical protein F5Y11DRAFT_341398 [Daldinia sp. FL1419]